MYDWVAVDAIGSEVSSGGHIPAYRSTTTGGMVGESTITFPARTQHGNSSLNKQESLHRILFLIFVIQGNTAVLYYGVWK